MTDTTKCKFDITHLGDYIKCVLQPYVGQVSSDLINKVGQKAQDVGDHLIDKVQSNVSADMTRLEADLQKVGTYLKSFITQAFSKENIDKLDEIIDQLAQGVLDEAMSDLDRLIDKEEDKLIHSLSPIIAWILVIAFAFHIYGGVFEKLPVSYRLLVSLLIVVTVPPSWRSKVDRVAVPLALALFATILYRNK